MDDTITINTPSGKSVVIRNYTTRKDDKMASKALYAGMVGKGKAGSSDVDMEFSPQAIDDSTEVYVNRLVVSIDGNSSSNLSQEIENLKSEDYEVIEKAVNEIVSANSDPKDQKTTERTTEEG